MKVKYNIKVNSIPNIGQVLNEVLQNSPNPDHHVSVDMPDDPDNLDVVKAAAEKIAYEGVITEVLGAVVAGMDIELEEVNV